jgi:indole-3-glycerol phosphate synthase
LLCSVFFSSTAKQLLKRAKTAIMANILDEIIAYKYKAVAQARALRPMYVLESDPGLARETVSLRAHLQQPGQYGIIAEFKRRSPSKGVINADADVARVTAGYVEAGAAALSVLTDTPFFGGSNEDLQKARAANVCPILRKDFIVDEYQILEARAIGADVILLIAACLEKDHLKSLARFAKSLGLEVLMEVHDREELDHWNGYVDVVGVNNRNLKTFEVSVQTSIGLLEWMPKEALCISESGINDPAIIVDLKSRGFQGFLIGEHFMAHPSPEAQCSDFIERVRSLDDLLKNAIA